MSGHLGHDEGMSRSCQYGCGTMFDLRPYGPGGAAVRFACVTSVPEREVAAGCAFGALLDAALAIGNGVAVLPANQPSEERLP